MTRKRRNYEGAEFVPLSELARRLALGERRVASMVGQGLLPAPWPIGTVPRWHWPTVSAFILEKRGPASTQSEMGEDDITAAITTRFKKAAANAA